MTIRYEQIRRTKATNQADGKDMEGGGQKWEIIEIQEQEGDSGNTRRER